jgi:hypothetical protein
MLRQLKKVNIFWIKLQQENWDRTFSVAAGTICDISLKILCDGPFHYYSLGL